MPSIAFELSINHRFSLSAKAIYSSMLYSPRDVAKKKKLKIQALAMESGYVACACLTYGTS
jgi:hypothetical protein